MKISISMQPELISKIRKYNKQHPDRPINVSAVCRIAMEKALEKAQATA